MGCNPDIAGNILEAEAEAICWPSRITSPPCTPISEAISTQPPPPRSNAMTLSTRVMAALEQRRYTVSRTIDWMASDRSYPGAPRFPQILTIAIVESQIERGDKTRPSGAPISPRATSRRRPSPPQCVAIGQSRTISTGHSMSPSARINHGYAPATAPKTWPWSDTSRSISSETSQTRCPSSGVENAPPETTNTSSKSSDPYRVNLDSLP